MVGDADISTQNMHIKDNVPGHMDSRGTNMDSLRNDGFMQDATLDNFFSRPVRIFETQWDVDSSLFERFNPWSRYWNNPRVYEKIKNYNLLKCNMHVKVLINGNAFYYGRAILAYEPLPFEDDVSYNILTRKNAYINQDIVRLSQRMKTFINPTESSGGSLELPFFWDLNCLNIPRAEWDSMGDCVLMSINDLQHANGGNDPLTITVLAWAENVSFAIPTASEPEMAEFPIPEMDEHEESVVSRPASTIARYAGALTNIPVIGPFMKATQIGAGAVAAVAKIFGYSSPTELDYSVMVPNTRSSMAVVDTKYPTNKLTIDSKQELTIDPSTTGIQPTDEMPIASIAGRESYLVSFDWAVTDSVDASLFQAHVDPNMIRRNGDEYHFTACAAAALPFKYWRGTMRFRFQIVSSNYHKGRLRIVYDPNATGSNPQFNIPYTTVHDISTEKDFTVDVGWAQSEAYREHIPYFAGYSLGSTPLLSLDQGNGVLGVFVLNQLTTPGTVVSNIQVNVYVSMLDDFEVAQPTNGINEFSFLSSTAPQTPIPEMFEAVPEMAEGDMGADMDCCDDPVMDPPKIDDMADTLIDQPDLTKLYFGEVIGSFRQLLKRTCLAEVVTIEDQLDTHYFQMSRRSMPELKGRLPNAYPLNTDSMVLTYATGAKYVPTAMTYISYVSQMFLGWRGAVRWSFDFSTLNVQGGSDQRNSVTTVMNRLGSTRRDTTVRSVNNTSITHNAGIRVLNFEADKYLDGAHLGNTNVNPIQSVEVPFYSNRRFHYTQTIPAFDRRVEEPSYEVAAILPQSAVSTDVSVVRAFCSAGEDLNFFFFNGLPIMFAQSLIPEDPGS